MRRLQSHMFSEKARIPQEPLITGYIDKLISRLHDQARKAETATVDLVKWYTTPHLMCVQIPLAVYTRGALRKLIRFEIFANY